MCAADDAIIGYYTEYLFFRPEPEWSIDLIADPRTIETDTDIGPTLTEQEMAERLAVMAWLVVSLEESFNWRPKLGLRRNGTVEENRDGTPVPWTPVHCPSRAHEIPALSERLILSHNRYDLNRQPGETTRYNVIFNGTSLRTV
ncbi:hypothetical protein SPBR_05394 [Sporothrix brasiliensis 5110]|uniref:Uncharacterized protein n=1 Tax=Sporothrix brasiliensis 5110 TaxID=1398154 RepID=A0A0C2ILT1_9PEZI|nr:uncharacterized protein SPBR_05394 [Sporothrix brasiliensis 5110]KIH87970.1 hypothetical protein SPBR_05394 [Sporothrix brasiliensis 5110]